MIKPISTFSSALYSTVLKPIMFIFPADAVHSTVARIGIITENIPLLPRMIRKMWRYDNERLSQNILGTDFKNPIGLSAGFDKEARLPKLMQSIGFGIEEIGSITAEPYSGNKKPWYTRLPHSKSILVNSGLKSSGVVKIANKADRISPKVYNSIVINASIARTNFQKPHTVDESIQDYIKSLKRLEKSQWHKMYTINISCPNTAGGEPFNKPENLRKLLKAIDKLEITRPLFLKLPIDLGWQNTLPLIKVADASSVSGLTIGNLSKDRTLVNDKDNLPTTQKGNLSGKPCWNASNELLAKTRMTFKERFVLIGVGGVFTSEDAYTKIRLGASVVELITGLIFGGPALIGSMNEDLVKLLDRDGLENISDAVGLDTDEYLTEHKINKSGVENG